MKTFTLLIFLFFSCNSSPLNKINNQKNNHVDTISSSTNKKETALENKTSKKDTIIVKNINSLIDSLKNNRVLIIPSGHYLLYDTLMYFASTEENNYIKSNKHGSYGNGGKLWLSKFNNLDIIGQGEVKIESNNRKVAPISLTYSKNVRISNIYFGHTQEREYSCEDGVFNCILNEKVIIENCVFDGSGIKGIEFRGCKGVQINKVIIQNCKQNIVTINDTKNLQFTESEFINNGCFPGIYVKGDSDSITFSNCIFNKNYTTEINYDDEDYLIYTQDDNVKLEHCTFIDNKHFESIGLKKERVINCNFLDSNMEIQN